MNDTDRLGKLRADVARARSAHRTAVHRHDRAVKELTRFNRLLRTCWSFVWLGLGCLAAGTVMAVGDGNTPLDLTGALTACFVIGSVVFIAAVVTLISLHVVDYSRYRLSMPGTGSSELSRAAYVDWTKNVVEDELDDLTEATTALYDYEAEVKSRGDR